MIQQRIKDIYYQQWYSEINNSRRLETYCLFKHNFEFETTSTLFTIENLEWL